ncbi:MAG: fumarylacetoacetate hydrolase family protein [Acidimicrobiia bacterium]|nr:fumarylacetoacetate hydrolase family protein [Acidimicrobiia bacterium]
MIEIGLGRLRKPEQRLVAVVDDRIVELAAAVKVVESGFETGRVDLKTVLGDWSRWSDRLMAIRQRHREEPESLPSEGNTSDAEFDPPVLPDALLLFAAANYAAHAAEAEDSDRIDTDVGAGANDPYLFLKPGRSVVGPTDPVVAPIDASMVDWEVELAIVIGKPGRRIAASQAMGHVAGYTICNDVSARDHVTRPEWPLFSSDWFAQKGYDTFTPIGPVIVPAAAVPDPSKLGLRLWVGDELMQDGVASEMIFGIGEQIEFASRFATLTPGDIISTGTPAGVGMATGRYLEPGEVMVAEIDGLGRQKTKVMAEDAHGGS